MLTEYDNVGECYELRSTTPTHMRSSLIVGSGRSTATPRTPSTSRLASEDGTYHALGVHAALVPSVHLYRPYSTCPGQHLAEELVFTSVARILALFNITPIKDAQGNPVIPSDDSTNGGIT